MTKQQEIREGIARAIGGIIFDTGRVMDYCDCHLYADMLLSYLHSQGVVLKVERELPVMPTLPTFGDHLIRRTQLDMLKAGYVAVEPLVGK